MYYAYKMSSDKNVISQYVASFDGEDPFMSRMQCCRGRQINPNGKIQAGHRDVVVAEKPIPMAPESNEHDAWMDVSPGIPYTPEHVLDKLRDFIGSNDPLKEFISDPELYTNIILHCSDKFFNITDIVGIDVLEQEDGKVTIVMKDARKKLKFNIYAKAVLENRAVADFDDLYIGPFVRSGRSYEILSHMLNLDNMAYLVSAIVAKSFEDEARCNPIYYTIDSDASIFKCKDINDTYMFAEDMVDDDALCGYLGLTDKEADDVELLLKSNPDDRAGLILADTSNMLKLIEKCPRKLFDLQNAIKIRMIRESSGHLVIKYVFPTYPVVDGYKIPMSTPYQDIGYFTDESDQEIYEQFAWVLEEWTTRHDIPKVGKIEQRHIGGPNEQWYYPTKFREGYWGPVYNAPGEVVVGDGVGTDGEGATMRGRVSHADRDWAKRTNRFVEGICDIPYGGSVIGDGLDKLNDFTPINPIGSIVGQAVIDPGVVHDTNIGDSSEKLHVGVSVDNANNIIMNKMKLYIPIALIGKLKCKASLLPGNVDVIHKWLNDSYIAFHSNNSMNDPDLVLLKSVRQTLNIPGVHRDLYDFRLNIGDSNIIEHIPFTKWELVMIEEMQKNHDLPDLITLWNSYIQVM